MWFQTLSYRRAGARAHMDALVEGCPNRRAVR